MCSSDLFRASEIKQEKRRQSLIEFAEQARISKKLVLLDDQAPVHIPLERLHIDGIDPKRLVAFLKAMEFSTLTKRVAEAGGLDAEAIEADAKLAPGGGSVAALKAKGRAEAEGKEAPQEPSQPAAAPSGVPAAKEGELTPSSLVAARSREVRAKFDRTRYETVSDLARLELWIAKATELGVVAVDTETTSLDAMQCELCGVSLAVAPNEACYIPLGHRLSDDLLAGGGLVEGQIPLQDGLARLKTLLENPAVLDRKSTRLNSSHIQKSRMPSSA